MHENMLNRFTFRPKILVALGALSSAPALAAGGSDIENTIWQRAAVSQWQGWHIGTMSDAEMQDRYGNDRYGSDRYGSDRYGDDRYGGDRYGRNSNHRDDEGRDHEDHDDDEDRADRRYGERGGYHGSYNRPPYGHPSFPYGYVYGGGAYYPGPYARHVGDHDDAHDDDHADYDHRDRGNYPRWNTGWRTDPRYDWSGYRSEYGERYRPGDYSAPYPDRSYSQFRVGLRLDPSYYDRRYWLDDSAQYRLPPTYGPYRWVRYYGDVLLIDTRSGFIDDAVYSFFR